ncbi:MAG: diadenylate cyclase CdaA [Bacteroidales bacterium]|nr:diadenylate cyclase CdaA [Bacteroidales bacterium]
MMTLAAIFDFVSFRIVDVLDILIVTILLFELYRLTKGTAAVKIFWVLALLFVIWEVVSYFHFTMLSALMGEIMNVGVLAVIILFQPEIRKFLLYIGDGRVVHFFSDRFSKQNKNSAYIDEIEAVKSACRHMSATMTGALIIFARKTPLDEFLNTGEVIDAKPSAELLENIFFKNSPLHDGAVIIKDHRIAAARCILPVSKNRDLPQEVGLRHRSALGATEFTDAIAVVVSEQTGNISICRDGQLTRDYTSSTLRQALEEMLTKE